MERKSATEYGLDRAPELEPEELVERVIAALETRGVPEGTWLVDINRVRCALQEADGLLRRLEDAVIRAASSAPRPD